MGCAKGPDERYARLVTPSGTPSAVPSATPSVGSSVTVEEVPSASRAHLVSLLDLSFDGIYRWHARRTLPQVRWV
ncbi:MAG TPA: hypothetical protein VFH83_16450, partial [Spirochaetia bacterium]|nr:hypothetical protein [Spirochaetia bacterium]